MAFIVLTFNLNIGISLTRIMKYFVYELYFTEFQLPTIWLQKWTEHCVNLRCWCHQYFAGGMVNTPENHNESHSLLRIFTALSWIPVTATIMACRLATTPGTKYPGAQSLNKSHLLIYRSTDPRLPMSCKDLIHLLRPNDAYMCP